MILPRFVLSLRRLILLAALAPWLALAADFPHETSDLPVDPAIKWGRLDNGLTYALLPNPEPKGRASLRLAIRVGSLHENDNQRGLAHFLEHMAFNGSQHFPAANVVEFFQRLGMNFGGDTNASTGFDRTVYQLELPNTRPATFREALTFFADVAGGLTLDPKQIDKERGIILSEKRARDSVALRSFLAELEFLVPDTRFIHRLPIGLEDVIRFAPRERFVDFYDTWYRPERMMIVITGDIDTAAAEALVREIFSPLAARADAIPDPGLGRVTRSDDLVASLHTETEAGSLTVSLQNVTPYAYEPDTRDRRLRELPRTLALRMLNRRLAILAKKEGSPFLSGLVGVTEQFDFFRNTSVELDCKPEQWADALAVAEQELRRALQHGFLPEELAEAAADLTNALQQAVRSAPTRRSPDLADQLTGTFLDRTVPTHPTANYSLYIPALAQITPEDCAAALRAMWADKGRKIFINGNLALNRPAPAILAAYKASLKKPVTAPPKTTTHAFAYTEFGKPGKLARTDPVADLGLTLHQFKNGVRLNLKATDFEADTVHVRVRVGAGTLTMPRHQPGLALLANAAFTTGGLGRHSVDDLQRLLAGKTVGLGFGAEEDAFTFSATTNRADLLLQLQLFCAYLTDPGYRPEAMRQVQKAAEQIYTQLAHTPDGPFQLEVARLLANDDPRFGLPPQDIMLSRTLDELRAWLKPEFATGPVEIAIVGDFDPDDATTAVAQTFGALPKRAKKSAPKDARRVTGPAEPLARAYPVETEIPKAVVRLYWPATDGYTDIRRTRRLNALAEVFSDRLRVKIREQMGGTYSPVAAAELSDTYPGYGFLTAEATVAPAETRTLADAIKAVAADLQANGVTDEELERAKQPALTAIRESARTNGYWLNSVLADAQEHPQVLDWSRQRMADVEAITAAELSALAKQYLDPTQAHEFIVTPTPKTPPASP